MTSEICVSAKHMTDVLNTLTQNLYVSITMYSFFIVWLYVVVAVGGVIVVDGVGFVLLEVLVFHSV